MKKRKNFIVPKEKKYICEHCGTVIQGGRYNNHCHQCLYSKHVDKKTPGDRASNCHGLMKPIGAIIEKGKWRIIHECQKCGKRTIVKKIKDDNFNKIVKLSKNHIELNTISK